MTFQKELMEFLYPSLFLEPSEHQAIQFVLAEKETKQAIVWCPGRRNKKFDFESLSRKFTANLIGFTGRTFRSFEISHYRQSYQLHWVGIDIDDITELTPNQSGYWPALQKVLKSIINSVPVSQIRLSTSGKGLHLIYRLKTPISFEPGIRAGSMIKRNLQGFVDKLEIAGIKVCCYSGGVFYLLGGQQQAIYTNTKYFLDFDPTIQLNQNFDPTTQLNQSNQDFDLKLLRKQAKLTPHGRLFFKLLFDDSILQSIVTCNRADIYVKRIYQALKGTKFQFETKSPMASVFAHSNGFLFKRDNDICLYTNADSKVVLSFEAFEI